MEQKSSPKSQCLGPGLLVLFTGLRWESPEGQSLSFFPWIFCLRKGGENDDMGVSGNRGTPKTSQNDHV